MRVLVTNFEPGMGYTARSQNQLKFSISILKPCLINLDPQIEVLANLLAVEPNSEWTMYMIVQTHSRHVIIEITFNETSEIIGVVNPELGLPLRYSFALQAPLQYYELKQLPNFLLAAPMLALSASGIANYAAADPLRFATLGFASSGAARPAGRGTGTASCPAPSSHPSGRRSC